MTPVNRDAEMEDEFATCAYSFILNSTDITQGPFTLPFKEPEPGGRRAPSRKKPASPRRRKTPK